MEMTKNLSNGTYDVTMHGKFTFNDHSEFRDILQQMAAPEIKQVILHMSLLEFVDSAALGMLLLARDEADKYNKQLIIKGPTGQVKKMFGMARFEALFTLVDDM